MVVAVLVDEDEADVRTSVRMLPLTKVQLKRVDSGTLVGEMPRKAVQFLRPTVGGQLSCLSLRSISALKMQSRMQSLVVDPLETQKSRVNLS